jgi:hypothetical protein
MARGGRFGRRHAVFGLVLFAHLALVALALRPVGIINAELKSASPLMFLDLPVPTRRENTDPSANLSAKIQRASTPSKHAEANLAGSATNLHVEEDPSSEAWPLGLGIDWTQEAQHVANSQAESIFKQLKLLCDEAALRGEQPPGCRQYKSPEAWVPEPKKFGIAGGLPYVRLGKRCVLGLGFFGCGVGKLPEPNGHVFDDMRDPDRPRSSIPDPNE